MYDKDKYKEAIEIYTKVLNDNNKLQLVYYNRGLCYIQTKDYTKALSDFNSVMTLKKRGSADIIWELNSKSPLADEEAKMQIFYDDALYQRAQVKWALDSIESSYQDFKELIDKDYKEKVSCIIWQSDLWHEAGNEENACALIEWALKLAKPKQEIDEAKGKRKTYCGNTKKNK